MHIIRSIGRVVRHTQSQYQCFNFYFHFKKLSNIDLYVHRGRKFNFSIRDCCTKKYFYFRCLRNSLLCGYIELTGVL